ncbi:hypothetical protein CI109_105975 [Kwoniella shandongensis]|uniref:Uncharacterized protein n=1 Tax=Kwoniella shandongensis TaxID=1734106 RepID=A0A5M6BXY7_9TREE|nr:uncharacterized protein CI109_003977 [Kwoniella shandongensis]KAA5527718.1 hypothetical protein CI109_003977 [Kwoniella shandongensis]
MSPTLFSPTLTASSNADDIDMSFVPEKSVQGFEDLFNFDEFDSAGDASSHTHSPNTTSPNSTPSPLPFSNSQEPFLNPQNNFDFLDSSMDFPLDFSFAAEAKTISVPVQDTIKVKQEPMDFTFGESSSSGSPTQARPMPIPQPLQQAAATPVDANVFPGLPVDQQLALQQLMENILNYQSQFGVEIASAPTPANNATAAPIAPSTIQPSMVFSNSPSTSSAQATSTSASTNVSPPAPAAVPAQRATDNTDMDVEILRSVDEEDASTEAKRNVRQESTFSNMTDDLDHKIERLVPLPAIFSAGKGKGGKKGGGMSSVVRGDDEDLDDDESWRPSPEEYKKLSSKEKRQLRNKLSARAFRTRRKDYIGTLEAHIKDRDSVIDEMRSELVNSRTENQDLRRELAALKQSTMSILHPESANKASISPAMVNALAMSPSLSSVNAAAGPGPNTIRRSQTPINTYNPRKDIPSTLKGAWGGNDNMFGGGSTICHTMFTPDLVLPSTPSPPLRSIADLPRVNLNPLLNEDGVSARGNSLANPGNGKDTTQTFSEWSENTPFSLRSMDSYRMQMWSRLAREAAADKTNLASDMRPKFFVEEKQDVSVAAAAAAAASSHISSKLASSFWSAFTSSGGKTLDTDKLAAVVTGTAKLRVVSNEKEKVEIEEDSLAMLMGGLKLQSGMGLRNSTVGPSARENPLGALCGFLKHASAMPTRA